MLGVEPQWVVSVPETHRVCFAYVPQHGLPDNVPFEMPNTGGVTVTPIEANHCELRRRRRRRQDVWRRG
jgi:DNA cross-link repair 1A protein